MKESSVAKGRTSVLFQMEAQPSLPVFPAFQVLSHNLCTVMRIQHDPVALEEHFKDDDEGPVSNQGYMPYLNRFILDKVAHVHHTRAPHQTCTAHARFETVKL